MGVISSDVFRLAVVKMTGSPPAVPGSPAFKVARLTGESLNFQPTTNKSNELDASGQVRDSILTGARTTGAVDLVLAKHTYLEEALASAFRNAWGTGQKGNGASTPSFSSVTADELIPGSVLDLYMIEKRFTDPTGSYLYHRISKSAVASVAVNVSPGAEVTANVNYSGGPMTLHTTALSGSTYADPGSNPVFTAPEVTEISLAGITSTLCFSNLSMEFNSNVRGIECIGTLGFREQVLGRFEATITGSAYFASNDLLQYLIDQTGFASTIEIADSLGNMYEFSFPFCKMAASSANASGTGQDVVQNVTINALYNGNWGYTCKVLRTAAP